MQTPQLRAEDNAQVHTCLLEVTKELQGAKYYTIMADETTDASNKEQLITVFHYVDELMQVHEDFVGLYLLDKTDPRQLSLCSRMLSLL